MIRIYFIVGASAMIFGAYFYGVNMTNSKCEKKYLQNNLQNIQQTQQKQRVIHDKVYKTGVGDIRRILRDKYTITY